MPSNQARAIAANVWCAPSTESIPMSRPLCEEFAKKIDTYLDALAWMSEAQDFKQGGRHHRRHKDLVHPLLHELLC